MTKAPALDFRLIGTKGSLRSKESTPEGRGIDLPFEGVPSGVSFLMCQQDRWWG